MQKLAWILVGLLLVVSSTMGWLYYGKKAEVTDLEKKIVILNTEIASLQSASVAKDLQNDMKVQEVKQVNELLDACYKALAGQSSDFDEINKILQLPKREIYEECNPDQDAACVDFLNRQLLDVH